MRRTISGMMLIAACCGLQAQTFETFKKHCIDDQQAACAAGKWWLATPVDDASSEYSQRQINNFSGYASYVCGKNTDGFGYSSFVMSHPVVALAIVAAAARIESDCSAYGRQMVLLQQQLDVAKENQTLLKGDIQAILGKLMPGATVTITLPPAKPASAPK